MGLLHMPSYGKVLPPVGLMFWYDPLTWRREPVATVKLDQPLINQIVKLQRDTNNEIQYDHKPSRGKLDWVGRTGDDGKIKGDCRVAAYRYRRRLIDWLGLPPGAVRWATCAAYGIHHAVCTIEDEKQTWFIDLLTRGLLRWTHPNYVFKGYKRQRSDRLLWETIGYPKG